MKAKHLTIICSLIPMLCSCDGSGPHKEPLWREHYYEDYASIVDDYKKIKDVSEVSTIPNLENSSVFNNCTFSYYLSGACVTYPDVERCPDLNIQQADIFVTSESFKVRIYISKHETTIDNGVTLSKFMLEDRVSGMGCFNEDGSTRPCYEEMQPRGPYKKENFVWPLKEYGFYINVQEQAIGMIFYTEITTDEMVANINNAIRDGYSSNNN